ncbi:hypothetical protein JCGZ_15593 [Jatropha curcas]|uniref:Gnk2-homologous domain-containing protein n=1 Tax=Jatropha curcas TaxID=180498 RepID=A0A067KYA3_JATCU|nr:cysteine-rich repeat secretory protein 38 [Jatropha curcas]KDP41186.1 hypothetical protein JCGZ_15593 [Jatropha curcas]
MASLLAFHLLCILSIMSFSKASQFPSLMSIACTSTTQEAIKPIKLKTLLDNLTAQVTKTRFITSTVSLGPNGYINGVMQCLANINPAQCTFCIQKAKQTVQSLCPNNTPSVTAWFDGCYLNYYQSHVKVSRADLEVTSCSCSNQACKIQDSVNFELGLETLLLKLRASIYDYSNNLHGLSSIRYGNNGSRIYAAVECVKSLSPKDCEVCVVKAIEKLYEQCGGKEGGIVASGYCIVRYESYKFFSCFEIHGGSGGDGSDSGGGGDGGVQAVTVKDWKKEKTGFKVKISLLWGVVVVCLMAIVFCAWLSKRAIINKARVAAFG